MTELAQLAPLLLHQRSDHLPEFVVPAPNVNIKISRGTMDRSIEAENCALHTILAPHAHSHNIFINSGSLRTLKRYVFMKTSLDFFTNKSAITNSRRARMTAVAAEIE